ncbi:MAG: hypothetical protein GXO40_03820 [Epsilonproteobacteria bacterium]|nr:hypothetical protein [Campylobacterota bacterium]
MRVVFLVIFVVMFLFSGCATQTQSVIIALKNKNIAIHNQAILKKTFTSKIIEVYNLGELSFKLRLSHYRVCINNQCMDKARFIKRLNPHYPTNLLDKIIQKQPLENIPITKTSNGFIQKTANFTYIVTPKKALFKDSKSHFLFLIREL